jgi:putative ABC transport system permease protein
VLKVALRGLLAHKWRLLTTFAAVALGVAFIGGVLVLTDTMNRSFDDLFADVYRDTDAVVRSDETIGADFGDMRAQVDARLLDAVAAADGVAAVDGTIEGYARVIDRDGEPVGDPSMGPPTFGGNWTEVDELNPFDLTDGRGPRSAGEIVIDLGTARDTGFGVGDRVQVQTQSTADEFEVVGVVRFGTAENPGGATYVMWTPEEAQRLVGQEDRYTAIAAVAEDGVSQEEVAASIAEALDDAGAENIEVLTGAEITEATQSDIKQSLSFITIFLLVFAVIAVFVGSFVIYNSFSIIVAQRTREMALLRAIGARRRQVRRSVVVEAIVIGLVGSVVGFLVGLGLASVLGDVAELPPGSLAVLPASVTIAIVTGLLVTVFSALLPAWRASRVPPLAAMREVSVDTTGRSRVRFVLGLVVLALGVVATVSGALGEQIEIVGLGAFLVFAAMLLLSPGLARPVSRLLGAPLARLRGVSGALARQNAGRNPKRTSSTAQALMIGVGLVSFILVINSSLRASIDETLEESFTGDFVVDSGTFGMIGLPAELADQIGELPEVATVAPVRWSPAFVDGDDTGVAGATAEAFELLDLQILEGDAALGPGEVVVNRGTAEDKGLSLGDPIEVSFLDDQRPEGQRTAQVSGIYDDTSAAGGIGNVVLNLDDWNRALANPTDGQVFVQLAEGVTVAEAEPAIEEVVEPFATAEVQSVEEYKDMIGGQLDTLLASVLALLALAVLIASLGIANTIALSVIERTRELGLLRAVGMRRRQVRAAIRWESVIISLFGTALGLAFGLVGGWGVVRALQGEGVSVFAVPFVWLVGLAVLAGAIGLGAALIPAWRASRMDVLRAIATE